MPRSPEMRGAAQSREADRSGFDGQEFARTTRRVGLMRLCWFGNPTNTAHRSSCHRRENDCDCLLSGLLPIKRGQAEYRGDG